MRLINDEVGDPNILCRCDTRPNDEDAVLHVDPELSARIGAGSEKNETLGCHHIRVNHH
jgi:hypothetical protein